jgi:ribonuclease-3
LKLEEISSHIGYQFKDAYLLSKALGHPSHSTDKSCSNAFERLEFLGDRVYNLALAALLYENFPQDCEGNLSIRYHYFSSSLFMADIAKFSGLAKLLCVISDKGERSVLTDTLEALIGAVYLDGGYDAASMVVKRWIQDHVKNYPVENLKCSKNLLQEWSQSRKLGTPIYKVTDRRGTDHSPIFTVQALIGNGLVGIGAGSSKQIAEQKAAEALMNQLRKQSL